MRAQEVCQICRLTKKALQYYEDKGLITPRQLDNGYRDYGEEDVARLKEISVLRQCGIGVGEVKSILSSASKPAALEKHLYLMGLREKRENAVRKRLEGLLHSYDVEREFRYFLDHAEDLFTIRERMALSFPGNYGLFLSLHFGRFLDAPADTEEKKRAYREIVRYLDEVEIHLSPELEAFLQESLRAAESTAALEQRVHDEMEVLLDDTDSYLERHDAEIEQYLAFKESDDFRNSPAGQLQRELLSFQQRSGYQERFLQNLKILSESYAAYQEQLHRADEKFSQRFSL